MDIKITVLLIASKNTVEQQSIVMKKSLLKRIKTEKYSKKKNYLHFLNFARSSLSTIRTMQYIFGPL